MATKTSHLDQAEPPQPAVDHRPRIQEDGLDVEEDEQHRDQVELDAEPDARPAHRVDAALIRLELGGAGLIDLQRLADNGRDQHHRGGQTQGQHQQDAGEDVVVGCAWHNLSGRLGDTAPHT